MMTDTSLQRVVQHQTVNLYDSNNVQLGETNTIHCRQTNHLKQDVDRMKNEIQQLKMNNKTQAEEIQQLKSDNQQLKLNNETQADEIQQLKLNNETQADEIQQLKSDNQQLKLNNKTQAGEIQQLKLNNETQADEIQQLKSRMKVMEVKTGAKKTNKNIFKEKDDMIELTMSLIDFDMTISISRDKTVDELEKMINEEYRKKYGGAGVHICYIYSDDFNQEQYNFSQHNKNLPLSHYNIKHGDKGLMAVDGV